MQFQSHSAWYFTFFCVTVFTYLGPMLAMPSGICKRFAATGNWQMSCYFFLVNLKPWETFKWQNLGLAKLSGQKQKQQKQKLQQNSEVQNLLNLPKCMTSWSILRRQKGGCIAFCPFAPVESLLVAKVCMGWHRRCWDIWVDQVYCCVGWSSDSCLPKAGIKPGSSASWAWHSTPGTTPELPWQLDQNCATKLERGSCILPLPSSAQSWAFL